MVKCIGIRSQLPDGNRHVVLLDYDHTTQSEVMKDVERLQNRFGLGDGYLFLSSSPDNFHVVIPDVVPFSVYSEILKVSKCDRKYRELRGKKIQGKLEGVLRITAKGKGHIPYYIGIIPSFLPSRHKISFNVLTLYSILSDLLVPLNKTEWDYSPISFVGYLTKGGKEGKG